MLDPITVDFETDAIVGNPLLNPPRPVGVALSIPGEPPIYKAWAHPAGNNCTQGEASELLTRIYAGGAPLLFHNAGFDLSVWNKWVAPINFHDWSRYHDTMYLLFLADPYASTLSLKPSADRYLGLPNIEQADLYAWIVANVPEATLASAGAYISRAPGELVGVYAIGDVVRTRGLFDQLHARIINDGMEQAYERERRLFPIVYDGTVRGIRIERADLERDTERLTRELVLCDVQLSRHLGCDVGDLVGDDSLADVLERSGAVKEWVLTPKSKKRSLSAENLRILIPEVKVLMDHKGALSTCLQTFMRPWLKFSEADGRLHPNWNQVKQDRGAGVKGTRTGRLSSDSPNFQNVPTEFVDSQDAPYPTPPGLAPLPLIRRYCLPEEGHVWLKRDFSSQEIRILAHFEDGSLCEAYRTTPDLDPHQMARQLIHSLIGIMYARKDIKITGFSLIYGTGIRGLGTQLGQSYDDAARIKQAYLGAMPDVRDLMQGVQRRGRSGGYIRTWGSRIYYAEPAKMVEGQIRDFAYKLLNYLIQGSAADQTKESIIDWYAAKGKEDIFLATVHDEINISAPVDASIRAMGILKESMNMNRFDVPMLSEGFTGPNWADLEACA